MRRLVVFPSDPISAYLEVGLSYDYLEDYYNPKGYFDEVYLLGIWKEKHKWGRITYICSEISCMKNIIEEIKPVVIRAYGAYISSDIAQVSKKKGIPIIVSVHDTNPDLIYDSLGYADYIICMTEAVRKAVEDRIVFDAKRIWVMPNRINENIMKKCFDEKLFARLDSQFQHKKHILHVGRKVEQKNLDTVIKAMQYLDNDVSAIFVGGGADGKYRTLAKECGVIDQCYFVESVKNEELAYWYSWCDCFCTPSRWEGFGFVFIEAAACETPIITSNIEPMNEFLTDGLNAVLVDDYENPKIIAEAIRKVLNGGSNIDQMCKEARNVGLRFSKDKVDRQEVNIYKYVIEQGVCSKLAPWILRKKWERKYR